jgi:hypothetical protein
VDWTAVENGIADVAGVPEEMVDHFSKRSREIRGRLDEVTERINEERARMGLAPVEADSQEALDIAARETRAAKLHHVATPELRAGWREEAPAAAPSRSAAPVAVGLPGPLPDTGALPRYSQMARHLGRPQALGEEPGSLQPPLFQGLAIGRSTSPHPQFAIARTNVHDGPASIAVASAPGWSLLGRQTTCR